MATYATATDLADYLSASGVLNHFADADTEKLLQRAERDVERAAGPGPLLASGLRFDPVSLSSSRRTALMRATCAAAEYRLQVGEDALVGGDEMLPSELQLVRRAGRQGPKVLEELAGFGLITFSGTTVAA